MALAECRHAMYQVVVVSGRRRYSERARPVPRQTISSACRISGNSPDLAAITGETAVAAGKTQTREGAR